MWHLLRAGHRQAVGQCIEHARELEAAQHGLEVDGDHFGGHLFVSWVVGFSLTPQREGVLSGRDADTASERHDVVAARRRAARRIRELEHALEAVVVVHLRGECLGAGLLDSLVAVAPAQAEQRVHQTHARPRQRDLEQLVRERADCFAVSRRLAPQERGVALGAGEALGRKVVGVDVPGARRLPRRRLDNLVVEVEATV